ncbi:MAG TPA: chloride channel protein [Terriglobales bacterium]|jgi:CIC family chloride channel protein|nr:chloride channel protein [Terriglobales bacterium]
MTKSSAGNFQPFMNFLSGFQQKENSGRLADFTTTTRVIPISLLAVGIGIACAYVAVGLLKLIGLFTNIFFYQRWDTTMVSPAGNHLGPWVLLVAIMGGLIVGLMGRYGSERIRGHGIPEAIEAILLKGARVEPKVALFKPVSAAIAIGSGGPFGAEGPIIMTGGAVGSLIAQFFHLTDTERKTLMVAGAAAGMSAIFASPVAAVLLAVELLLFEWKPRSLIPVALASAIAAAARRGLLGTGPIFPLAPHDAFLGAKALAGCALVGLLGAAMVAVLSKSLYAVEDWFPRLRVHWMWWPAIGAVAIGVGGYIFPPALGVGYDVIASLLRGDAARYVIIGILLVKSSMWVISLGSGNSGGILAPLLMMGGGLGAALAWFLPYQGAGFWPLLGMAAVLTGAIGSPLTAMVFAVELTHDVNMLLPLLIAVTFSHAFIALTLPRSIVTEKLSRRGYHLSREYSTDPLENVLVHVVMRTNIIALPGKISIQELTQSLRAERGRTGQWLYPVVESDQTLLGVITRKELQNLVSQDGDDSGKAPQNLELADVVTKNPKPVVAYPDEPLRAVVYRMAESGLTRLPVIQRANHSHGAKQASDTNAGVNKLVGMVSLNDLLKARVLNLEAERKRERILPIRIFSLGLRSRNIG